MLDDMQRASYIAGMKWQPIETAPRSWANMLLLYGKQESHSEHLNGGSGCSSGEYCYVGCWSETANAWVGGIFWPTFNPTTSDWSKRKTVLEPTHWMPLPAPPKHGGKRAGGLARAAALSPARRSEIAKAAANARWQENA
jgi:hypothetical protein